GAIATTTPSSSSTLSDGSSCPVRTRSKYSSAESRVGAGSAGITRPPYQRVFGPKTSLPGTPLSLDTRRTTASFAPHASPESPAGAEPAPPRTTAATGQPFDNFTLPEPVREGLRRAGFTHCTPIQEKSLPIALAGRDVAGQAQTGTGKTAAFLITLFTRLLERERQGPAGAPRALIVPPPRELAAQIAGGAKRPRRAAPFRY